MFTGIVQGIGEVDGVERLPGLSRLRVKLPAGLENGLQLGASISVDGVCLTVSNFQSRLVSFDVMQETLARTTLGNLTLGSRVNVERAATHNTELGGHLVSGHIDTTARVVSISNPENNHVLRLEVERNWSRYIFSKGFIALNGASLTISNVDKSSGTFEVWLIPETLRLTTFAEKKVGDRINLEIDRNTQVIVDTVREFLIEKFGGQRGVSLFLKEFE